MRAIGLGVVAGLAVLVAAVGYATPASAHDVLIASTPEAGETLTVLPDRFSVTTNGPMLSVDGTGGFALQIVDEAGAYYGDGCIEIVDATMSTTAALGEPGSYTMLWQAVSSDGHSIDGEIEFRWQPAGDAAVSPGQGAPPTCGAAPGEPGQPAGGSDLELANVLWIGGGVLAFAIATAIAIMVIRRRGAS